MRAEPLRCGGKFNIDSVAGFERDGTSTYCSRERQNQTGTKLPAQTSVQTVLLHAVKVERSSKPQFYPVGSDLAGHGNQYSSV